MKTHIKHMLYKFALLSYSSSLNAMTFSKFHSHICAQCSLSAYINAYINGTIFTPQDDQFQEIYTLFP